MFNKDDDRTSERLDDVMSILRGVDVEYSGGCISSYINMEKNGLIYRVEELERINKQLASKITMIEKYFNIEYRKEGKIVEEGYHKIKKI